MAAADLDTAIELVTAIREFAFRGVRYEILDWAGTVAGMPGAEGRPFYPVALGMLAYGRYVRGELADAMVTARRRPGRPPAGRTSRPSAWPSGCGPTCCSSATKRPPRSTGWTACSPRRGPPGTTHSSPTPATCARSRTPAVVEHGDLDGARELAAESDRAARRSGSPTALAQAAYAAGLSWERDDPARALDLLVTSGRLAGSVDNRWLRAFARTEELYLRAQNGEVDAALEGYREVVDTWFRGGEWANQWLSLRHLFGVFASRPGDEEIAAVLHGALESAGAGAALPFEPSRALRVAALVDAVRARYGRAAFDAAVDRGRAMDDQDVVRMTLDRLDAHLTAV